LLVTLRVLVGIAGIALVTGRDGAGEKSTEPVRIDVWRPPGARPLPDRVAAARVAPAAEIRPGNRVANHRQPSDAQLARFHAARFLTGSNRAGAPPG